MNKVKEEEIQSIIDSLLDDLSYDELIRELRHLAYVKGVTIKDDD